MPPPTVSQRLRARLRTLLTHGEQVAIEKFSRERPGGAKISQQNLSYFLHPESAKGRRGLALDDLDDLAAYLRISVAELLGDTTLRELSGDEQRVVLAFRVLPAAVQEHFMAVIEQAALGARFASTRRAQSSRVAAPSRGRHVDSAVSSSLPASDAATELASLRQWLLRVSSDLAAIATGAAPDEPLSGAGAHESNSG